MMLTERAAVPASALPVGALIDHLRLGTGFEEEARSDALAEGYLRRAIAAVERRTGKALLTREFALTLSRWRDAAAEPLPLAPVGRVISVTMTDRTGRESAVAESRWRLIRDLQRPRLAATGAALPAVPPGGGVEVVFEAGFGGWAQVPGDLAQAVLLLAAQYHELREERETGRPMPFGVEALLQPWRTVRLLGGAR
ncbi:head-tail connector protein [Haematobacter genomosp. 1]|uniref:Phage gp6-like head-tail connector protein n=1 Tax=Haematobacter genomosp. 1 TaxID=366618 RepID=A0A212AD71_9RHOB|nr:hypothetical protein [Haematobacter genomosp. 1]OWJ78950.1 hypothetical protein CDV49_07630 [Haematobacter genomosp. 1]